MLEKPDRFETFVLLIDATHKCISKVKAEIIDGTGVKSVHTMWLYELLKHSTGLTATELAAKSMIDRSLVSREINTLARDGYVMIEPSAGKRGYNSRITLTKEGEQIAKRIADAALEAQNTVGKDIDKDDLISFYTTLEKIYNNLTELTDKNQDNA